MSKQCSIHGLELVKASVTDSRGKTTVFLRCPFGFQPDRPMSERTFVQRCMYMRPLKLYRDGKRIASRKKP
jgi:hypothetical protein